MVSIHRPLGYGPSTLPLRHSAYIKEYSILKTFLILKNCNTNAKNMLLVGT